MCLWMNRYKSDIKMWLNGLMLLTLLAIAKCSEAELTVEAAFQGRCGRNSPCEQLCYEIHDGMYECDCSEGFELNKNGYSCQEINSTFQSGGDMNSKGEEDVLYQKGVSFSAKLVGASGNMLDSNGYEDDDPSENGSNFKDENISSDSSSESFSYDSVPVIYGVKVMGNNTKQPDESLDYRMLTSEVPVSTASTTLVFDSFEDDVYYAKQDMSVYDDVNNNKLNIRQYNQNTYQGSIKQEAQHTTASSSDNIAHPLNLSGAAHSTPLPKVAENSTDTSRTSTEPCLLDCGLDGICEYTDGGKNMLCLCPFGKTGRGCSEEMKISTPRFTKKSWLAFPALRGAYKHVQLRVEFRPESFDGIILLTGERDDLTGDFMALLIHQGFIEFWFDCGSGTGSVRSKETVLLNQWNSVTIYRHRWDAWLVLNHGTRVQGRSKGLFSRITFREPVFLGGTGNITDLTKHLPVYEGMVGCIRRFTANEHDYKFTEHPLGDVIKGFDIQDCTTDKCVKYPCQHGGKCLPSDQGAVCLCPLGFGGDLCEMRLDLQVPSFNGSSYLRYAPLGDSALIWLELLIIIKPLKDNGLLLYSGHNENGDYIALSLNKGFIEFAFDLGSGPALVRSQHPLSMGQWHTVKVSRTARLAVLKIDQLSEVMTISSNGFWHLSLPHSLFLGGIHTVQNLPIGLKEKGSFVGCIQKVEINGRSLSIISEALGGTNVDNCPHACVAKPCGPLAQCVPLMDNYECRCNPFNAQCNKAEEVPLKQIMSNKSRKYDDTPDNKAKKHRTHHMPPHISNKKRIPEENVSSVEPHHLQRAPFNEKRKEFFYDYEDNAMEQENFDEEIGSGEKIYRTFEFHRPRAGEGEDDPYAVDKYMTVNTEQLLKKERFRKRPRHRMLHQNRPPTDAPNIQEIKVELSRQGIEDEGPSRGKSSHHRKRKNNNNERMTINRAGGSHQKTSSFGEDKDYPSREFMRDMERIMKNSDRLRTKEDYTSPGQFKKTFGACFTGTDSYFHYNDAETMSQIISYKIDLNLRFKTHSNHGVILWSGRQSALESDDFLSLGIEDGFLHLRYNLGSGETSIKFNSTKVSDGLWHRVRATRNLQEGSLEVDGRKSIVQRSPGKLRQLNTDTGLYVGGMPDVAYFTRRRYFTGVVGCISEIVLAGELRLNLDPATLGTAHNVEVGIL